LTLCFADLAGYNVSKNFFKEKTFFFNIFVFFYNKKVTFVNMGVE